MTWSSEAARVHAALVSTHAALYPRFSPAHVERRSGYDFRHPLVEAEAGRLGLTQAQQMPGMVAAPADQNDLPATDIAIERVTGERGLANAQAVSESGFGAPPGRLAALYTESLAAAPGFWVYVGRADGTAVATSVGALIGETVGVFAVATHPDFRRRGYGAAVTSHAVRNGFAQGAQLAWLQSSELGKAVYGRMGFRSVETYNLFTRT